MYYLTVSDYFSAAHQLTHYQGKCENLHGHNWKVEITVKGQKLNDIGLLIDFTDLKKILKAILSQYDHKFLNDIPILKGKQTSSEIIAQTIFTQLKEQLIPYKNVEIYSVRVYESNNAVCEYREE